MIWFRVRTILLALFVPICLSAQTPWKDLPPDSLRDLTEVVGRLFHSDSKKDIAERKKSHIQIGIFPAIGYTLQTASPPS